MEIVPPVRERRIDKKPRSNQDRQNQYQIDKVSAPFLWFLSVTAVRYSFRRILLIYYRFVLFHRFPDRDTPFTAQKNQEPPGLPPFLTLLGDEGCSASFSPSPYSGLLVTVHFLPHDQHHTSRNYQSRTNNVDHCRATAAGGRKGGTLLVLNIRGERTRVFIYSKFCLSIFYIN